MIIACLGWGSLIWKPGALPMDSEWFSDGPGFPIEFSRVGDQGELATAVCMNAPLSNVLWALLRADSLQIACAALREREQIPDDRQDGIGVYVAGNSDLGVLGTWCAQRQIDAVIWTALPPRFEGKEGLVPSVDNAVAYLEGLSGATLAHARNYIKQVPTQIATPYRQEITHRLGWA